MRETPTLRFKMNGKSYDANVQKLTGRELRDAQIVLGMPLTTAMQGNVEHLVWMAAVVWLMDRRDEKSLAFDDVLDAVTYEALEEVDTEDEEPDPPTQEGNSSEVSPPSPVSTDSSPGSSSTSPSKSLAST